MEVTCFWSYAALLISYYILGTLLIQYKVSINSLQTIYEPCMIFNCLQIFFKFINDFICLVV